MPPRFEGGNSQLDIRHFRDWVKHDLAIQSLGSVEFYKKAMGTERFLTFGTMTHPIGMAMEA